MLIAQDPQEARQTYSPHSFNRIPDAGADDTEKRRGRWERQHMDVLPYFITSCLARKLDGYLTTVSSRLSSTLAWPAKFCPSKIQLTTLSISILPSLDDYACLICTSIAFKPIRLSCQHLFCVRCLVKMQRAGQAECPLCRSAVVLLADKSECGCPSCSGSSRLCFECCTNKINWERTLIFPQAHWTSKSWSEYFPNHHHIALDIEFAIETS